jgi:hypothetical protein
MRLNLRIFLLLTIFTMILPFAALADGTHSSDGNGPSARVGELAYFEGTFDNLGQGPFTIRFHAKKLEDGAEIITLQSPSADGTYRFGVQFFDGAEHEVTVQAINPTTGAVLAEKTAAVEVEAFNPPAPVILKTMAFLFAVMAVGMTAGVGIQRWVKAKRQWKGGNPRVA